MRLVEVDAAWEELFGLRLREVEGTTGIHLVHARDQMAGLMAGYDLVGGLDVTLQLRLRLRGRFRWCVVAVQPLFDHLGRFDGAHGFTRETPGGLRLP